MSKHNRKAGALGFLLLGLVAGCASGGTESDARSVFSMSGASDRAISDPYGSGKEHLNARRFGNAVAAFRLALAQNPANVKALNGLAAAYDRLGRHDLAEAHYRRALNLRPSNVQTLNNFGFSNLLQGRLDIANALLSDAHDIDPEDRTVGTNLQIVEAQRAVQQAELNQQPAVVETWRAAAAENSRSHVERTTAKVQSLILQNKAESPPSINGQGPQPEPTRAIQVVFAGPVGAPVNRRQPAEESRPTVSLALSEQKQPLGDKRPGKKPAEITVVVLPAPAAPEVSAPQAPGGHIKVALGSLPAGVRPSVSSRRDVMPSPGPALVLSNGTGRKFMARRVGGYLRANDVAVVGFNNADSYSYPNSTVFYKEGWELYAKNLAKLLPGRLDVVLDTGLAGDIDIRLGADALQFDKSLFYADVWRSPGVAAYPELVVSYGTHRDKMAARIQSFLETRDVEVSRVVEEEPDEAARTTVYYSKEWSIHALRLARLLPVDAVLQTTDDPGVEVRVVLGNDLSDFDQTLISVSEISTYAWSI